MTAISVHFCNLTLQYWRCPGSGFIFPSIFSWQLVCAILWKHPPPALNRASRATSSISTTPCYLQMVRKLQFTCWRIYPKGKSKSTTPILRYIPMSLGIAQYQDKPRTPVYLQGSIHAHWNARNTPHLRVITLPRIWNEPLRWNLASCTHFSSSALSEQQQNWYRMGGPQQQTAVSQTAQLQLCRQQPSSTHGEIQTFYLANPLRQKSIE